MRRDASSIPRAGRSRPHPRDVRTIAGLLGIRYRALADGDFNHTTVLVLLDAEDAWSRGPSASAGGRYPSCSRATGAQALAGARRCPLVPAASSHR